MGSLSVLAQDCEQYGPRLRCFFSQNLQFFSLYIPGILLQAGYYLIPQYIILFILYIAAYYTVALALALLFLFTQFLSLSPPKEIG